MQINALIRASAVVRCSKICPGIIMKKSSNRVTTDKAYGCCHQIYEYVFSISC